MTRVPAGPDGVVDPDDIRRALRPDTVLISIMHANNELGTLQPIAEIAKIAREAGVLFHADGVQALGKTPVDVQALGVDLYTISGHKIYAPKGSGRALRAQGREARGRSCLAGITSATGGRARRTSRARWDSGAAAEWLRQNQQAEWTRLAALRDRLESGILARVGDATVNGAARRADSQHQQYPLRLHRGRGAGDRARSARLRGIERRGLLERRGRAVACPAGDRARRADDARSSIRFSLGRSNTAEQVDALVEAVAESVAHLRRIAPVRAHA